MSRPNHPTQPGAGAPGQQFDANWGQPQGGAPEPQNPYSGFSIGAIVALVGSVVTLAGYQLTWFYVGTDPDAKVSGFGSITNSDRTEVMFESTKIHWLALGTAVGLIIVGIARLLGNFTEQWKKIPLVLGPLGVASALFSLLTVDDGLKAGTGLFLTLAGTVIGLVGVLLIAVAKK